MADLSYWLAALAACAAILAGCASPTASVPRPAAEAPPLLSPGLSTEGRLIRCSAFGSGTDTVLILAGIHGDEPAGKTLAEQLRSYLESHPGAAADRRVVVVPATNPDGLARGRRANARGIDLNRNFATENWRSGRSHGAAPLSEPETQFIADLIRRCRPALVLALHEGLTCVDWDGPAREVAEAMSQACGLPLRKIGAEPGSLGSYAGVERQIPTVTIELPRSASQVSHEMLWQRYGQALLVAIRFSRYRAASTRVPTFGGSVELESRHFR